MGDGQELPEEFPKKLKDRICPSWKKCVGVEVCEHIRPHPTKTDCDETCTHASGDCIHIPELFMDNGGK